MTETTTDRPVERAAERDAGEHRMTALLGPDVPADELVESLRRLLAGQGLALAVEGRAGLAFVPGGGATIRTTIRRGAGPVLAEGAGRTTREALAVALRALIAAGSRRRVPAPAESIGERQDGAPGASGRAPKSRKRTEKTGPPPRAGR